MNFAYDPSSDKTCIEQIIPRIEQMVAAAAPEDQDRLQGMLVGAQLADLIATANAGHSGEVASTMTLLALAQPTIAVDVITCLAVAISHLEKTFAASRKLRTELKEKHPEFLDDIAGVATKVAAGMAGGE